MKVPLGSMFLVAALVAVPVLTHAAAPQTPAVQPTDKTIDDQRRVWDQRRLLAEEALNTS